MNFFEFYNIPVSFNPDQALIKKLFYQFSKENHPDFHTDASEQTKEEVLKKSALNNEAYKTLKDYDKRLKYVLELKAVIKPSDKDEIPQEFLIQMMDINERIMEVQFDFNDAEYQNILNEIDDFEKGLMQTAADSLAIENPSEKDLEIIKNFYYKKKYLRRLKENVEKVKEE